MTTSCVNYDKSSHGSPPGNGYVKDVTLVKVNDKAVIRNAISPVHGLGWIEKEEWFSLQGEQGTRLKLLREGVDGDLENDVMTNQLESHCQVSLYVFARPILS
jgi:hypothetical protein